MGLRITGTGHFVPGRPYTNNDLARVMETSDDWVFQRTGIRQRYFCPEGMGVSDLAREAALDALKDAGKEPKDLDYIIFNTMTPDHAFPGSGALLGARLGCPGVPALDLRQQCAAQIFSMQVAQGLIETAQAKCILVVGAEAHSGFMPWVDWDVLEGTSSRTPDPVDWDRATRHRGFAIIFGDGAGAMVVEPTEDPARGILSLDLHTDGRYVDELIFRIGFRTRPFVSEKVLAAEHHLPQMAGREVFKHAVTKLPASIRAACRKANVELSQIDWFIAHQANLRINEAIRERLKVAPEKVPSNIERFGNTSTATIPILIDEMRHDGRLKDDQLICLFALGAGLHWGTMIVRT